MNTNSKWLPLPFPECVNCCRSWEQCVHSDCGGGIDVQPMSGAVRCSGCNRTWKIWESSFRCPPPCNTLFEAREVEDGLALMLDHCRQLIFELSLMSSNRDQRAAMGRESLRSFISGIAQGLGRMVGIAVEAALRFFFP